MPTHANSQTQMSLFMGLAPCVDADGQIDNIALKFNVIAKAASYTVKAKESGSIFTTTGATAAVTFTLPAPADGLVFYFFNTVDQDMIVASHAADLMIGKNDAAASNITYNTASEKIGAALLVICDGSKWCALDMSTGNTVTVTA